MTKITFHGVRGSWPQSGNDFTIGGHTLCVEATVGTTSAPHTFIFDAGTGMTHFSQKSNVPSQVHLFLSHYHMDHVIGLTLLEQLFSQKVHVTLHAPILEGRDPKSIFDALIRPPLYPFTLDLIAPSITFQPFHMGETLLIHGVRVETMALYHPGSSCGYRIYDQDKNFCYITDVGIAEGATDYPDELSDFIEGTDLLIQDTYFNQEDFDQFKHYGHGAYHLVPLFAKRNEVKKLAFYHHNPHYNDAYLEIMEKEAQRLFAHSFLAIEGQKISI